MLDEARTYVAFVGAAVDEYAHLTKSASALARELRGASRSALLAAANELMSSQISSVSSHPMPPVPAVSMQTSVNDLALSVE